MKTELKPLVIGKGDLGNEYGSSAAEEATFIKWARNEGYEDAAIRSALFAFTGRHVEDAWAIADGTYWDDYDGEPDPYGD